MNASEQRERKPRPDVQRNHASPPGRAMEEYFRAFSGLMAAARAQDPDNPLTISCDICIAATDKYVEAAQNAGHVRATVRGYDLFVAACSIAWIEGADDEWLDRLRTLLARGYRERDEKS